MGIALLIISCLSLVLAFSFLMAAVFTFATCDQKPVDRETDRFLCLVTWLGGGAFIYVLAVAHHWRYSRLGRRLFYTGLVSGAVAVACGYFAARGI